MPVHGGSAAPKTQPSRVSCLHVLWQPGTAELWFGCSPQARLAAPAEAAPCQRAGTPAAGSGSTGRVPKSIPGERPQHSSWGPQGLPGHTWDGNSRAAASALKQNLQVPGEAQPQRRDMITLLRADFPPGIGKSYKHLHKPNPNPRSGWPTGGTQSCAVGNLLWTCECAGRAVWRASRRLNQGFVQIVLSGTCKDKQNLSKLY